LEDLLLQLSDQGIGPITELNGELGHGNRITISSVALQTRNGNGCSTEAHRLEQRLETAANIAKAEKLAPLSHPLQQGLEGMGEEISG
jgi:hypothetical protein